MNRHFPSKNHSVLALRLKMEKCFSLPTEEISQANGQISLQQLLAAVRNVFTEATE